MAIRIGWTRSVELSLSAPACDGGGRGAPSAETGLDTSLLHVWRADPDQARHGAIPLGRTALSRAGATRHQAARRKIVGNRSRNCVRPECRAFFDNVLIEIHGWRRGRAWRPGRKPHRIAQER